MQAKHGKAPRSVQLKTIGVELSREARTRLAWMDFYQETKNVTHTWSTNDLVTTSDSLVTIPVYDQSGASDRPTSAVGVNVIGFLQVFIQDAFQGGGPQAGQFDVTVVNVSGWQCCVRYTNNQRQCRACAAYPTVGEVKFSDCVLNCREQAWLLKNHF